MYRNVKKSPNIFSEDAMISSRYILTFPQKSRAAFMQIYIWGKIVAKMLFPSSSNLSQSFFVYQKIQNQSWSCTAFKFQGNWWWLVIPYCKNLIGKVSCVNFVTEILRKAKTNSTPTSNPKNYCKIMGNAKQFIK